MLVKYGEILNLRPIFEELAVLKLPIRAAAQIARNLKIMSDELQIIEPMHKDLVAKYWEPMEGTGVNGMQQFSIKDPTKTKEAQQEMNELMKTEINVDLVPLGSDVMDNLNVTPQEFLVLEKFIDLSDN